MLPDRKYSYSSGGDLQNILTLLKVIAQLAGFCVCRYTSTGKTSDQFQPGKKFSMYKITATIPVLKSFCPTGRNINPKRCFRWDGIRTLE